MSEYDDCLKASQDLYQVVSTKHYNTDYKAKAAEAVHSLLHSRKIDVNYRSGQYHDTALNQAVINDNTDVFRYLLSHPNLQPNIPNILDNR